MVVFGSCRDMKAGTSPAFRGEKGESRIFPRTGPASPSDAGNPFESFRDRLETAPIEADRVPQKAKAAAGLPDNRGMSSPAPRPSRTERQVRIDLAAAFRLAALNGWDDTVYTHLSATVPGEPGTYLINEF